MKKVNFLLALLCTMVCSSSAWAVVFDDADATKPVKPMTAQSQQRVGIEPAEFTTEAPLAVKATAATTLPARAPRRAVTASDFASPSIEIEKISTQEFYGSHEVTMSLSGTTLTITNLGGYGTSITATVDLENGTFTIPRQQIYNSSSYGQCDIIKVNDTFTSVDTTGVITGTVADGTITLSPWCAYIISGSYKGYTLGKLRAYTTLNAVNATMSATAIDSNKVTTDYTYNLYVEQTGTNQLEVFNIFGVSSRVKIGLSGSTAMTIKPQLLWSNSDYGAFYLYPYDATNDVVYLKQPITGTTTTTKLEWGGWAIHTSNGKYYAMHGTKASIQLNFELTYPTAQTQAGWKGSGTEADPYLIENIADLLALSDSVNLATPYDTTLKYCRAYEGIYFKQTAAINLKGYVFPPIGGSDDAYRFAGTYDGGNKVISYLNVEQLGDGYAGLFGTVDTMATIKNVKLNYPTILSTYYYTGALAGHCWGTVDNVAITGANVSGKYCVGGAMGFGGTTTNVSFTNGTVIGETQVGGVIGVTRSPVSYLSATRSKVTCTSTSYTSSGGGVVGFLSTDQGGQITDSYFDGTVIATYGGEFVGGVLGVSIEAPVERCFSIAELYSISTSVSQTGMGGIVGGVQAAPIKDCFFTGMNLIKNSRSGGIVGYAVNVALDGHRECTTLDNCYVACVLNGTSSKSYMPFIGLFDASASYTATTEPVLTNCYFDRQAMGLYTKYDRGTTTDSLATATALTGFSTDVWTFTDKVYPRLTNIAKNATSYAATAPVFFSNTEESTENVNNNFTGSTANSVKWYVRNNGASSATGKGLNIESNKDFVLNGSMANDTIEVKSGSVVRYLIVKLAPASLFTGSGTEDDPFQIKTKQDVLTLCEATNTNKLTYVGTYFLVMNDIDMELDTNFIGIGSSGTSDIYAFGGILDGGNHVIDNVYYVTCATDDEGNLPSTKPTKTGFINMLGSTGVVKNLRIGAGSKFEFYSRCGGIVGVNSGQIINCRNYADVKAHSGIVGGICGYSNKNTVITGCYNSGKITAGYQYAAGIVATSYAELSNCMNVGEICCEILNNYYSPSKLSSAGGIVEMSQTPLTDVMNAGYIHAPKYVGGIEAWFNKGDGVNMITNGVNVGIVDYTNSDGANTIGNMVGKLYKKGTLVNCYYDKQLSMYPCAHGDALAGGNDISTARLTEGSVESLGLDTALWMQEPGKYPILKSFADEPGAQAAAMSVVYFDLNARCDTIKSDCELYQNDGLTWSVLSAYTGKSAARRAIPIGTGSAFQIKDNLLWMDPATTLTDTVVATYQGFEKRIPVMAQPDTVPTPNICYDMGSIWFTDDLADVTYYYTTDGTEPTLESNHVESDEDFTISHQGSYTVTVIGTKHNYYPSQPASENIEVSGISEMDLNKEVATRQYISPAGIVTTEPTTGLNIVVTTYTDGTKSVTKVIR